ncbi:MAG: hypothetical protein LBC82_03615 [Oscillospiraceae bacterium]|jgi:hypothetical protein|nr:hypothetical protein [Oscillospiraceae bacterium]
MKELKSYKSWTISDEFWEAIKGELPTHRRDPEKEYKRKPGGGAIPELNALAIYLRKSDIKL